MLELLLIGGAVALYALTKKEGANPGSGPEPFAAGTFTPDARNTSKVEKAFDIANRTMATASVTTSVYQSALAVFKKNPTEENKKKVVSAAAAAKKARAAADKAKKQKPGKKDKSGEDSVKWTERERKVVLAGVKILQAKGIQRESKLLEEFRKISAMSSAAFKAMGQQMGFTAAEMKVLDAAAKLLKKKSTN